MASVICTWVRFDASAQSLCGVLPCTIPAVVHARVPSDALTRVVVVVVALNGIELVVCRSQSTPGPVLSPAFVMHLQRT